MCHHCQFHGQYQVHIQNSVSVNLQVYTSSEHLYALKSLRGDMWSSSKIQGLLVYVKLKYMKVIMNQLYYTCHTCIQSVPHIFLESILSIIFWNEWIMSCMRERNIYQDILKINLNIVLLRKEWWLMVISHMDCMSIT